MSRDPDHRIIKPREVGHWDDDGDFVVEQEVTLPGTGKILEPGMRIPMAGMALPRGITRDYVLEVLINNRSEKLDDEDDDGIDKYGVTFTNQQVRLRARWWIWLANVIGVAGNFWMKIGRAHHQLAWWLIRPR